MDVTKAKERFRQSLRERRAAISEDDFIRKSQRITDRLRQQPEFRQARTIHCYVSMNRRREVNTHPLIRELLAAHKRLVVPVTNFADQNLDHLFLHSFDDLKQNKWGVLEPETGERCSPEELDLIIVPMVGGDEQGRRIGYGGGFYDRFLQAVNCPAIGLCFEETIVPELPTEPFDVPLDKILTDQRVIQFSL